MLIAPMSMPPNKPLKLPEPDKDKGNNGKDCNKQLIAGNEGGDQLRADSIDGEEGRPLPVAQKPSEKPVLVAYKPIGRPLPIA